MYRRLSAISLLSQRCRLAKSKAKSKGSPNLRGPKSKGSGLIDWLGGETGIFYFSKRYLRRICFVNCDERSRLSSGRFAKSYLER